MAGAVTTLVDQVVAETVATSNISSTREALEWALQALHTALTSACLGLTSLATTVDMPGIGKLETLLPLLDDLLSLIRVQVLATSPDLLAGIVAHDKDFVSDGYRSVYMSFEPEASMETTSETLLVNAVEWVKAWRYRDRLTLVGNAVGRNGAWHRRWCFHPLGASRVGALSRTKVVDHDQSSTHDNHCTLLFDYIR